jgi:predicted ATPase
MLTRLRARGFKSLRELEIELPRLTVLFGPNASGKSNVLEAAHMLSRCSTERTLSDAFDASLRGYPLEAFSFGEDGLPGVLRRPSLGAELEADLEAQGDAYRYRLRVEIQPGSGGLSVQDEHLVRLDRRGEPRESPRIERVADALHVRQKSRPGRPLQEPVGRSFTCLSDPRFHGDQYSAITRCRAEFEAWRIYYLDPRVAMRAARPPADVRDIGALGEDIAPFLYRLRAERPKHYDAVRRAVGSVIPSVDDVTIELDERRGTLDIQVMEHGCSYSSRVVSEGTLRVLALCAIVVNPWVQGLVGFEEPENGVHPRRLDLIAQMLVSLASSPGRQVVVTTHSPLFCSAVLRSTRDRRDDVRLYAARRNGRGTTVTPFVDHPGTLFFEGEMAGKLTSEADDGELEGMMVRGWLDG